MIEYACCQDEQPLGCSQAVRHETLTLAFVGSNPAIPAKCDPLAQLVEHMTFNHGVPRSNRGWVTNNFADVAKLADALDLGSSSKEWGFKSSHPHQRQKARQCRGFFRFGFDE